MFEQCPKFREALAATGNKRLFHSMGKTDPRQTILTEKEFCAHLTAQRPNSARTAGLTHHPGVKKCRNGRYFLANNLNNPNNLAHRRPDA